MNMRETMEMMEILTAMEKASPIYEEVKDLGQIAFLSLIGTIIDRYGAEHRIPMMELHKNLYTAAKDVFKAEGEFGTK